jgi:hypothetical protein
VGWGEEVLVSLEDQLVKLSDQLPKLPEGAIAWLKKWAWLIALIAGILDLLSAAEMLMGGSAFMSFFFSTGLFGASVLMYEMLAVLTAVYGIIYLVATKELHVVARKGWHLVFVGSLIQLIVGIIGALFFGFGSIIAPIVLVAIGWYLLFQIRAEFVN